MEHGASYNPVSEWVMLYPTYIDSLVTWKKGRRVRKEDAVAHPRITEIMAACTQLGITACAEPLASYPRSVASTGAVSEIQFCKQVKWPLLKGTGLAGGRVRLQLERGPRGLRSPSTLPPMVKGQTRIQLWRLIGRVIQRQRQAVKSTATTPTATLQDTHDQKQKKVKRQKEKKKNKTIVKSTK